MMTEFEAEVLGDIAQAVAGAGELRPRSTNHHGTVEPSALGGGKAMMGAGPVKRRAIEAGVGDDNRVPDDARKFVVNGGIARGSCDPSLVDTVDRDMDGIEIIVRVHINAVGPRQHPVSEDARANLTNARQPRIGGLEIQRNEIHRRLPQARRHPEPNGPIPSTSPISGENCD